MTVEQVLEKVGDDPYSIMLVWRSTKRLSSRTLNDVQWAVYDVHTGAGQGGIASHAFLSTHDVLAYVQDMMHNMNARDTSYMGWPTTGHYGYTDWECGSIEDFANWLKRGV